VPRQVRRQRQIITQLVVGVVVAALAVSVAVIRYPGIIPGAQDLLEQARLHWDLATLRWTVKINVEDAVFWSNDLLVVDISIENNSRFVILSEDLRLIDRGGQIYIPSSTSVYYVTRDQSLWMRQINPGQKIRAKYAFTVPDRVFGLMFAVNTEVGLIKLQTISEVSRAY
jgi:hypothetical protein